MYEYKYVLVALSRAHLEHNSHEIISDSQVRIVLLFFGARDGQVDPSYHGKRAGATWQGGRSSPMGVAGSRRTDRPPLKKARKEPAGRGGSGKEEKTSSLNYRCTERGAAGLILMDGR